MTAVYHLLRISTIAFSLTAWLTYQSSGMAGLVVFANSTSNVGGDGQPVQATSGTVVDVAGGTLAADFTDARASASAGQLRAYSEAWSAPGSAYFGVFATNSAYFRDDFFVRIRRTSWDAGNRANQVYRRWHAGNLLTDYTFTSASGFNYTQSITAVPEPSSLILGMLGCSALALRRRFRSAFFVRSALTKN